MSYSPEREDAFYRVARLLDRLLNGTKASDLPVEQIATTKLVVNLKTARALGITVPQSVLLRANEFIR